MERDPRIMHVEQAVPARPAAQPSRAPERIAMLYRRMMAARANGRGAVLDLPDLAGCYDTDL